MKKDTEKVTDEPSSSKSKEENKDQNKSDKKVSKPKKSNDTKNIKDKEDEKNNSKELINPEELKTAELETIKKEIKNTKKISKLSEKKQMKYKEILINLLIACFIVLYYLVLIIGMQKVSIIQYITDLKIVILVEAIITVVLFEIAYKKDSSVYTLYGIEMLAIGITTTFLLDLVSKQSDIINIVEAIIVGCFTLYYLIKVLIMAIRKNSIKR